jgi:hypothetical protein
VPIIPEETLSSPNPTIEQAREARAHSGAYQNMIRACGGFVLLVKRIEPFLKGTPAETPVAIFTAIADVIEVRLLSSERL